MNSSNFLVFFWLISTCILFSMVGVKRIYFKALDLHCLMQK
jgi:hypothetical protein